MIRLRTLGSLQLRGPGGEELDALIAQSRRVALLVYLLLAEPRGFQRRDALVALFWPEQDDAHARNALSQAVHFLRRTLGPDVVISRADGEIAIDRSKVWCDAIAFEEALAAGMTTDAVELYAGPLLLGFHISNPSPEFERWLDDARRGLAGMYSRALETMAERCESSGDFGGAVAWHRKLAAAEPLSSRRALRLMKALVAAGEVPAALQQARIHEALLRAELDVAPDPQLVAYVRELQAAPRAAAPPPAPAPPPAARRGTEASVRQGAPQVPSRARPRPPRRGRAGVFFAALFAATAGGVALTRTHAPAARPETSCLAILPLDELTPGSGDRSLADGIADAIITELAHYDRPNVISRTSSSRYRKTDKPLPEIARDLECDGLVEGTVARQNGRIRVSARLIHEPDDHSIWSESYESDTSDILALERRVAESIARQVRGVAVGSGADTARSTRHVDPITMGLYRRGRDAFGSRNPAMLRQALALFGQAVARDSSFALGYAGLADTYRMIGGFGYGPGAFWTDSAPRIAAHALALDSSVSEAHASLAATLTDRGDWPAAEAHYRRAIGLEPGNAQAHHWYAVMLITLDRRDEALREIRRAQELDPLSQAITGAATMIERYAGVTTPRGTAVERKALVDPTHPGTIATRSVTLAASGKCDEARVENRRAEELAPGNTMIGLALVAIRTRCGDAKGARALLDSLEQRPDITLEGVFVAEYFAARGEPDSAFAWLDRAQWGMQGRLNLRVSSKFAPLRADPRFARLLARLGMP